MSKIRLIDANALPFHECADSDCIEASKENCAMCEFRCVTKEEVDNAPTVETERPQGKWLEDIYHRTICNVCGGVRRDNRFDYMFFCNRCGADMRTKGENQGGDV